MMFPKGWSALILRNLIYRRRNWMATIAEFALPILFCTLLVVLKEAAEKSDHFHPRHIKATFPSDIQAIQIFSFTDYVTALKAQRICLSTKDNTNDTTLHFHTANHSFDISGMPQHGRNWQVPFIQCDSRKCQHHGEEAYEYCHFPKLGLAAKDEGGFQRAQKFEQYIYQRYPQLSSNSNTSLPALKDGPFIRLFESNRALEDYTQHPDYGVDSQERPKLALAIVFAGNDTQNYDYTIRVNSTNSNAPEWAGKGITTRTTPDTNRLFASYAKRELEACGYAAHVGPHPQGPLQFTCTGQYILNGLLTMQRFLHDWIMVDTGAHDAGLFVAEHGVKFVPFPSKAYSESGFYTVLKDFLSLILTLGFLYPCASMISYIARERELGQKEFLKIMSAKEWEIGTSWFCTFFSLHLVTATVLARVSSALFPHSDRALLWVFWQSACLAFIVFSSWVPSLISRQAKTASRTVLIGLLVFLAGYFMSQAVDLEEGDPLWLRILCLHPVAAFSYGVQEIGRLEDAGAGATWNSFQTTDSPTGFSVFTAIKFLWLDCILGTMMSWYFNRVIPGADGGHSLSWTFPLQPSYWLTSFNQPNGSSDEDTPLRYLAARIEDDIPVEPVSDALRSQAESGNSIEMHNLRKVFPTKTGSNVTAVDGLNLSLHQGQVTALLGHNGSGKSTTINLLTGCIIATDGFHVLNGKHSATQMPQIRENMGICTQHNDCLFSKLTVRETLQIFCRLKGEAPTNETIDQALREVALHDKDTCLVMNLSGGMKRKLCVAIAFCGDSEVVILDEPTSGMDPFSRRSIWNVIKQKRQGRIILLTTHFLDEADILADRIAILSDGRLQCVGSSLFLKRKFGVGYQLTVEKTNNQQLLSQSEAHASSGELLDDDCNDLDEKVKAIVTSRICDAELLSTAGKELAFHLPLKSASKFSTMLRDLETEVNQGTLASFGVSMTTLDEVFQKITRRTVRSQGIGKTINAFTDRENERIDELESNENSAAGPPSRPSHWKLQKKQMAALLRKRKINFTRDKKAWFCTTLLPGLFVLVGFLSLKYASPDRVLQPLDLKLNEFNPDVGLGMPSTDRNPVPYNNPGSHFKCQPGWCSYQMPIIEEKDTNELYFYCGAQSYLLSLPNCSQAYSRKIVNRLMSDSITPIGEFVRNISESSRGILHSADRFEASQYGAIFFTHDPNSTVAPGISYAEKVSKQCHNRKDKYALDNECELYTGLGYVISYNYTALHASPLFQKLADEAIVREAIDSDTFRMSPTIHPLPRTHTESRFSKEADVLNLWFMVVLSFPFIAGHVANFIVEERQSKAKHLQTIAGVRPTIYWASNLVWDSLNYQIPLWFTIALMYAFDVDVFTTTKHSTSEGVLLLLFLFGPAAASFAYCISFFFTSGSLCNIFIIMIGFLTGMTAPISSFSLRLIGSDPEDPWEKLLHIAKAIECIGLCLPFSCMGKGLFYTINIATFEMRASKQLSVWDPSILLYEVIALVLQTMTYLLLAVCLDRLHTDPEARAFCSYFKSFLACRLQPAYEECATHDNAADNDVIAEEERIQERGGDDVVVLRQVSAKYGNGKVAVDHVSLGIGEGECFGLLGTNGAGKTTTMAVLTSEFPPTTGEVIFAGQNVTTRMGSEKQQIGFCPQFDAIFENLTGQEHVEFYAQIKGMDSKQIKTAAERVLSQVGIGTRDKDRLCSHYSGGTKRKLSMACAMIGDPAIVFFDEVSTGIDPVSRREIWQTISGLTTQTNLKTNKRTCVILTTHSMEECEALCSRIGIMSRGRLLCLGSAQHLKTKFGHGYQIELRVRRVEEEDNDFVVICEKLSSHRFTIEAGTTPKEDIFFDIEQTQEALASITGDHILADMITGGNPEAATVFNEASSPEGVSVPVLASFAALELRVQGLDEFLCSTYPGAVQRERQDMKVRYEISSSDTNLADIFSTIEGNKEKLWLSEYGVNQTSLEQVFNMLAERDSGQFKSNANHNIV